MAIDNAINVPKTKEDSGRATHFADSGRATQPTIKVESDWLRGPLEW